MTVGAKDVGVIAVALIQVDVAVAAGETRAVTEAAAAKVVVETAGSKGQPGWFTSQRPGLSRETETAEVVVVGAAAVS